MPLRGSRGRGGREEGGTEVGAERRERRERRIGLGGDPVREYR